MIAIASLCGWPKTWASWRTRSHFTFAMQTHPSSRKRRDGSQTVTRGPKRSAAGTAEHARMLSRGFGGVESVGRGERLGLFDLHLPVAAFERSVAGLVTKHLGAALFTAVALP